MARVHVYPAVYVLMICGLMLQGPFGSARADLIGYWPLDEQNGDVVADQTANGLDGIVFGGAEWVDGMFGGGLQFNGSGDHVEIGDDAILRFGADDNFTAMAWVFIPDNPGSGWRGIVNKSRDRAPWWGIWINPQDEWVYGENGNHIEVGQIEEGWHHLAISQNTDEAIQYLYLDGDVLGEYDGLEPQNGTGDLWFGGAKSVSEWFIGTLDEVRVYDEALTIDEIVTIMAGPSVRGDFDANGTLGAPDIDELTKQSASGLNVLSYDLNADAMVNVSDVNVWVKDLFNSWIGDANLDRQFSSSDLVAVLASGTYEANLVSVWSTGDFNGDGRTSSSDLVVALADGGYEQGPRPAVSAVPEPTSLLILCAGLLLIASRFRRGCR